MAHPIGWVTCFSYPSTVGRLADHTVPHRVGLITASPMHAGMGKAAPGELALAAGGRGAAAAARGRRKCNRQGIVMHMNTCSWIPLDRVQLRYPQPLPMTYRTVLTQQRSAPLVPLLAACMPRRFIIGERVFL